MIRKSELISIQEAAAALGISEQWLRQLARSGRVRGATKVGRDWVIPSPPRVLPSTRPRGYHGHNQNQQLEGVAKYVAKAKHKETPL
jgi:excisionase family DNA binding protein